jgi:YidC/Oxa1 family membrane protein insertase
MLAFAPIGAAVGAASTVLSGLTALLAPIAGADATAAAVVAFTISVRLAVAPLSWAQARGQRRSAALAPRLNDLHRTYGKEPERLRAELTALYRETGASPLAGCLPGLLQAPFFLVMYRLFATDPPPGALFGVPLGAHLTSAGGPAVAAFVVLLGLLVLLAVFFWNRSRRAVTPQAGPLGRALPLLPFLTVPVAVVLPVAAVMYLVVTTSCTALEHLLWRPVRKPLTNTPVPRTAA